MAKAEYKTVDVDGIEFVAIPVKKTINNVSTIIGYGHMPVITPDGEDDAHDQLSALVDEGVFTWQQIVGQGLYNIYLKQSGKINADYKKAESGDSFDAMKAMTAFPELAKSVLVADGPEAMEKALREKWEAENKGDVSNWDADEHKYFPKDVR